MVVPIFAYNPLTGNLDLVNQGGGGGGSVNSVSGTPNRITSTGGANPVIDVAATYVGQTSITTLGTVTTGTWAGTSIAPTSGGTGLSTYTTGDILYASAANTLSKLPIGTVGQLLTVAGGLPTWASGSGATITLTGNTGGGLTNSSFNLLTDHTTAVFAGSGSTITLDFNVSNLLIGSLGSSLSSGSQNVAVGANALLSVSSASANTALGSAAGINLSTGGFNTYIGNQAGQFSTTCAHNTAVGAAALGQLLSHASNEGANTAIGYQALNAIATGKFNTSLGYQSGKSLTLGNSSNIMIGNLGVAGDNNTMRLGTQGTGDGQVNQTFIAGLVQTYSGRIRKTTTVTTTYQVLSTDDVIYADSTTTGFTITLLASPADGQQYVVKDANGTANTNNITVVASSGNIDGLSSFVINANYGAATFIYNATATRWSVI